MANIYQVFVGTDNSGVFVTYDFVNDLSYQPTWTAINAGLPALGIHNLEIDHISPYDYQYALLETPPRSIYRRVSGGNWELCITKVQAQALLGAEDGGLYWVASNRSVEGDVWALYQTTIGGAPTYGWGLIRSTNYGLAGSWVAQYFTSDSLNYGGLNLWVDGTTVWVSLRRAVGAQTRIFKSVDSAATWKVTTGLNTTQAYISVPFLDSSFCYSKRDNSDLCIVTSNGALSYVTLQDALNIAWNREDAMWQSRTNINRQRLLYSSKMYSTVDAWANVLDVNPPAIVPNVESIFTPSNYDDLIVFGREGVLVGNPHAIMACIGDYGGMVGMAGVNAAIPGGGGDSIGFDCGGICQDGIKILSDASLISLIGGIIMSEGRVITKHQNTVYLQKAGTFDPFEWGGACMKIGDITKARGAVNPTYCQNVRDTGVSVTGVLRGLPGLPTTELAMKETQRDTKADELENCAWNIDRRTHCKDLDYWNGWEKIRRVCSGFITDRTDQGSAYDEDDSENIVTLPVTGSNDVISIYRTSVSIDQGPNEVGELTPAAMWVAASVCHGEKCSSRCNSEDECVIAMVSTFEAAGTSILMVNNNGGHPDYWTEIAITEFATDDAVDVLCLGDFILIASENTSDAAFVRSFDQGVTQEAIVQGAPMIVNKVQEMDAIDQAWIVACGLNGYIYGSVDQGANWTTLDGGIATVEDLHNIKIARDNPLVIYAVGDNNAIVKSENGGETFFALTGPSAADNLWGLYILDENHILVGNDDGELWESSDGGETWSIQDTLPDMTATAGSTIIKEIVGCGCGVLWLIVKDTAATSFQLDSEQRVYRNVDSGASGRWFTPENGNLDDLKRLTVATGQTVEDIVCCGPNRALVVGGEATTPTGFTALLA